VKKTPWFLWPAKPSRIGHYEVYDFHSGKTVMLMWNGYSFGWDSPLGWEDMADDESDRWRGLSEKPE